MKIFFDTEFTGLVPNTALISIGMITENGEKLYAEFTDFKEELCDEWIKENVLANLWTLTNDKRTVFHHDKDNLIWYYKGDSSQVKDFISIWFDKVSSNGVYDIELVSDVCHYDMTLLCNLFGGAFNLPKNVCPACYDICQDLVDEYDGGINNMKEAFDYSREDLCKFYNQGKLPNGGHKKHNSLYDAEVIKMIYEGMR